MITHIICTQILILVWLQNLHQHQTLLCLPVLDADSILGDELELLEDFSNPNFNFQVESDDEVGLSASISHGEFHELNKKIDQILLHTNSFSTTNWQNMVTSHQATIEMVTTSNVDIFENQKDLAADSAKKIADVEAKIDKVVADVEEITSYMKKFMVDFQTSSNKNVVEVNKFIEGFGSSLQSEKESPSILCCGLQHDNVDHHMSITNSILRMQTDLAHENKTMDALTEST